LDTYRAKEDQTMAMFRQMAEEQKKRGGLWMISKGLFCQLFFFFFFFDMLFL
jgi:hypothetical protein